MVACFAGRSQVPWAESAGDVADYGSLVTEEVTHFECAGAGVFARVSGEAWFHREWGYLDLLRPDVEDALEEQCGLCSSVLGPWLLALQSAAAVHAGVDALNAVRHVGRCD